MTADQLTEFRRWAEAMAPAGFVHARTALALLAERDETQAMLRHDVEVNAAHVEIIRKVTAERDAANDLSRRLADRIHAAHEVIGKFAERRVWDGTEHDYCVLGPQPGYLLDPRCATTERAERVLSTPAGPDQSTPTCVGGASRG